MKGLDLRNLKKVSSDDKMTVFKHDMGHEIKIAHARLSPKMLKEIQDLPMKGQKPQKFAEGSGDVQPDPQPNASPSDSTTPPQAPVVVNVNGGQGQPSSNQDWQGSSGVAAPTGQTGAMPTPPAPLQDDSANSPPSQPVESSPVAATTPAPVQPMVPPAPPTAGQILTQPVSEGDALTHLNDQTAKLRADFNNGQITPETYSQLFNKKDTLGKIGTIFGLLVGGAGAGLSHQPNALLGMMDKEIDRDLEGQKQTKSNQFNALNLAENHYRNEVQSHFTAQQGANTEAATRLANVNTQTAASNLKKTLLENAVYQEQIKRLGLLPQGAPMAQKGQAAIGVLGNAINQQQAQRNQQTAQQIAANGQQVQSQGPGQAPPSNDHILSPDAEQKYQQLLYDPSKTPAQKQAIQDQYLSGVQTDKAIDQVNELFPQLMAKRTWGGYLANKVNPNAVGEVAGLGAEAAGIAGAIPTAGTSLLGAVPGALAAGALGKGAGTALKQGLTAMGGHQEVEYQNAKDALTTIIGGALGPNSHLTPTEIGGIAEQYIPTKTDNEESAKDKLEKLKTKIKTLAKTGALKSAGMTNDM